MEAFWISFGLIFVAELGDKSQLMAMAFATRYRALTILAAITTATALVHLLSVALAFFLAELGDKTMLATVTLATDHGWFGTWLGSTVGMVAADALAIVVGQQLGARLPARTVKVGAAITFVVFGVWLIVEGLM